MTAPVALRGTPPRVVWGALPPAIALAIPAILLGATSSLGATTGVGLALLAVGLPFLVRPWVGLAGRALPFVSAIGALAVLAATAPPTTVPSVLAVAAGIALVFAMARYGDDARPVRLTAVGLFVPVVGAGIALTTALLFGASERLVGAAGLLIVATVVAIALLLAEPERVTRGEPVP